MYYFHFFTKNQVQVSIPYPVSNSPQSHHAHPIYFSYFNQSHLPLFTILCHYNFLPLYTKSPNAEASDKASPTSGPSTSPHTLPTKPPSAAPNKEPTDM